MKADIFHTETLHYSQVTTKYTFATWARMRSCVGLFHVWRFVACGETEVHPTCGDWWHVTKHRSIPRVEAGGAWRNTGSCHVWRLTPCDETQSNATCGGWCHATKSRLIQRVQAGGMWRKADPYHVWSPGHWKFNSSKQETGLNNIQKSSLHLTENTQRLKHENLF